MKLKLLKYRQNRLRGMTQEEAALKAGYTASFARKRAYILDKRADVGMAKQLHMAGLTNAAIANETATIAFNATKIHSTQSDFVELPDNPTRLKALEFASKLKGLLVNKTDVSGNVKITKMEAIKVIDATAEEETSLEYNIG